MTIAEMRERGKRYVSRIPRDVLVVGILILSSTAAFGLGILAGRDMGQGGGFSIEQISLDNSGGGMGLAAAAAASPGVSPAPASIPAGGQLVASKSGTKYYFPWCSGAARIAEANKVWFASAEEAKSKGYSPASNCKGL